MRKFLVNLRADLDGRKTHLVALVFAAFNVLVHAGLVHVSASKVALINSLLAAAGLSALRVALNK